MRAATRVYTYQIFLEKRVLNVFIDAAYKVVYARRI